MPTENNVIDWELSVKLAGGQEDLALELLHHFMKSLDESVDAIRAAYEKSDLSTLKHEVHRLHGAVCYCGFPKLKVVVHELEQHLKLGETSQLSTLFAHFNDEIGKLRSTFTSFKPPLH